MLWIIGFKKVEPSTATFTAPEGRWKDTLNGALQDLARPVRIAPYQVMLLSNSGGHYQIGEPQFPRDSNIVAAE